MPFFGDPYGYLPFLASENSRQGVAITACSREPMGSSQSVRCHPTAKKHTIQGVLFAGDPYGTRTHVTTVKGWCLNRLTNGPYIKRKFRIVIMVAAMRFELMTYRV